MDEGVQGLFFYVFEDVEQAISTATTRDRAKKNNVTGNQTQNSLS